MIYFPFENLLYDLVKRFPSDARWGVSCGSALTLHDLDYKPSDLDFFAPRKDAHRIANELSDMSVVFPFQRRISGVFDSYFGRFRVDGVDVDLVGDFSVKWNNHLFIWDADHPCWSHLKASAIQSLEVPLFSLEDLLLIYLVLPNEETKAKTIVKALKPYGKNDVYLKQLISQPPELEGKLKNLIDS